MPRQSSCVEEGTFLKFKKCYMNTEYSSFKRTKWTVLNEKIETGIFLQISKKISMTEYKKQTIKAKSNLKNKKSESLTPVFIYLESNF